MLGARAAEDALLRGQRSAQEGMAAMRDLDAVRSLLAGPGPTTLKDLPWIAFFIIVLMLVHMLIGMIALLGGMALLMLTWIADRATSGPTERAGRFVALRVMRGEAGLRHVGTLTALGMRERMLDPWEEANLQCLAAQSRSAQSVNRLAAISKMGRMLLQSLILTVGAWLVINGEASAGVIFASSMLAARALAPVDQAIGNWRSLVAARQGWKRLQALLAQTAPPPPPMIIVLLPPCRNLLVEQLAVTLPGLGRVTVQGVDFALEAGDCLAAIGPSGAGKSSLGRALTGLWLPARGLIRLNGARLDQWASDALGRHMGYLPQTVGLLEGSVVQNIARFDGQATSEAVIAAACAADVHEMILSLPHGYDTPVAPDGGNLSQGQQQRIGLARALYGDPFLLVLDEPNSNLDMDGDRALEKAIASVGLRGGIIFVIAPRPSAIAGANRIVFLRDGRMEGFGPRDEMMRRFAVRRADGRENGEAPVFARASVSAIPSVAQDTKA